MFETVVIRSLNVLCLTGKKGKQQEEEEADSGLDDDEEEVRILNI